MKVIENMEAYEAAIKRNIIFNARQTFLKTYERANEVIEFLNIETYKAKPFELWQSFASALETYGKLTEKQYLCVCKAIDKRIAKAQEKQVEFDAKKALSNFVGTVGQREKFIVKIEKIITVDCPRFSYYDRDSQEIYLMVDENNNRFIYRTKSYIEVKEGDTVEMTATMKEHNEYKGEKQNIVSRPKFTVKNA